VDRRAVRVAEWKQSGKTADEFAADKPYKGSRLVSRAWQLRRGKGDGARKERMRARPMSRFQLRLLQTGVRRPPGGHDERCCRSGIVRQRGDSIGLREGERRAESRSSRERRWLA
jgi:hypothetical protein